MLVAAGRSSNGLRHTCERVEFLSEPVLNSPLDLRFLDKELCLNDRRGRSVHPEEEASVKSSGCDEGNPASKIVNIEEWCSGPSTSRGGQECRPSVIINPQVILCFCEEIFSLAYSRV